MYWKATVGLSELELYEAILILGEKGDRGGKFDQGPRGFTRKDWNALQIDPNGHLTQSSDGLRLPQYFIETKRVKTELVNVKHISTDTIIAVCLAINQETKQKMRIGN